MRTLGELLEKVDVLAIDPPAARELPISGVNDDTRKLGPGELFIALPGQTVDGHAFLGAAAARGAVAALIERADAVFPAARVIVPSVARAFGQVAANWYRRPADALRLTGITGTNGKTTCSYLVESLLTQARTRPGVIGTVGYRWGTVRRPAPFTTPTPLVLHETLASMRDDGCTDVVLEASSHALALERLEAVDFSVAAFTNLTQDHLDFHPTMEAYADEKARLFSERLRTSGTAVVCVDGPYGEKMAAASRAPVLRVSASGEADVRVLRIDPVKEGTALALLTPSGPIELVSPLVGGFNVENLVVTVGIGIALGISLAEIAAALRTAHGAPGRLERVAGADIVAYVDYAHTPDALQRALAALRPSTTGQLWVVFGAGGDRDRGKRPLMGALALAGADHVVVTSDNPRTEPAARIIDDILAGMPAGHAAIAIADRRLAILHAVEHAAAGDVILVAGKGHEDYQIVGAERRHFDDREVLAEALQRRRG